MHGLLLGLYHTSTKWNEFRVRSRLFAFSFVAVVSLDDTRLFVDATLRATLRTEAEEDWTCEGVPVLIWFLFNTEVRSECVVLMLSRSVTSSTLLRVGRSPVRVMGPLGLAPEGVVRSSAGTLISIE